MWKDEVLEEIHKFREEYAKSFNYDIQAIFDDLRQKQEKQAACGRRIVSTPLKQPSQNRIYKQVTQLYTT